MEKQDFIALPNFSKRLIRILTSVNDKVSNFILSLQDSEEESIKMLDFVSEDNEIVISYLPIGKEPVYAGMKWSKQNRQRGKIGKTFKTFLKAADKEGKGNFSDREIELFVNCFKSKTIGDFNFVLVSGDDIRKYYSENNYLNCSGSLGNSCMRYEECQEYFNIYTKCSGCELLIVFDHNKSTELIVGRALVWTGPDGKKYVDRRYGTSEVIETAIVNYAKSKKWGYKSNNTYDLAVSTIFMVYDNGEYKENVVELSFVMDTTGINFPYSDTFCYVQDNLLTNSENLLDEGDYKIIHSTDGDYSERMYVNICPECGKRWYDCEEETCIDCFVYCEGHGNQLKSECIQVLCNYARMYILKSEIDVWIDSFEYNGKTYFYNTGVHGLKASSDTVEVKPDLFMYVGYLD